MAHKVKGIAQNYSSHESKELLSVYESALSYLIPETVGKLKIEVLETKKQYETKFQIQQNQIQNQQKQMKEQDLKIDGLGTKFEAKLAETMRKAIDFINQAQKQAK
jgi:transposase